MAVKKKSMIKRVIDKRVKEKFMMDDAYLNGQAKICGWQATLVYLSLCRHASISQESFPSLKLISEELKIDKETVVKGLRSLEKYSVITIKKSRTNRGKWLNNTYILLDKSGWVKSGGEEKSQRGSKTPREAGKFISQDGNAATDKKQSRDGNTDLTATVLSPVQDGDAATKETQVKETHSKETHLAATPPHSINSLLQFFKTAVNPHLDFANKTERKACASLIEAYGLERVKEALLVVEEQRKSNNFLPVVTTPYHLWTKWAAIKQQLSKNNKTKGVMIL